MDVLIKNVQDNSFVELYKRSSRSIAAMEKLTPGVYQIYHHLLGTATYPLHQRLPCFKI